MTTIPTILIKFKLKIKPISLNKMMITSLRTIMLIRKTATVAKSITTLIGKIAVTKTTQIGKTATSTTIMLTMIKATLAEIQIAHQIISIYKNALL